MPYSFMLCTLLDVSLFFSSSPTIEQGVVTTVASSTSTFSVNSLSVPGSHRYRRHSLQVGYLSDNIHFVTSYTICLICCFIPNIFHISLSDHHSLSLSLQQNVDVSNTSNYRSPQPIRSPGGPTLPVSISWLLPTQ